MHMCCDCWLGIPERYLQLPRRGPNRRIGRDQPGVSLFLGMPVPVVTTPHGTAYDIAWKGIAKHNMVSRAITMAAALAGKGL